MPGTTLSRPVTRTLGRGLLRPFSALFSPSPVAVGATLNLTSGGNNGTGVLASTGTVAPTTTDAVIFGFHRRNSTAALAANPGALTYCGLTVTKVDWVDGSTVIGNSVPYIGYVRNLIPGVVGSMSYTGNGINNWARIEWFIVCLTNWQGNIGAFKTTQFHGTTTVNGPASVATPLVRKASLMLGAAAGSDAHCSPYTASGFTALLSATNGTTGSVSNSGTAFSKTGGAVGGTETLTPVAAATFTDHSSALVEVY